MDTGGKYFFGWAFEVKMKGGLRQSPNETRAIFPQIYADSTADFADREKS